MASTVELENAQILRREISEALQRGTKHFRKNGSPLLTVREVLYALMEDGEIVIEPRTN